jgi:hypothetical protein
MGDLIECPAQRRQHPPKIPLFRSTSSANASHVDASSGRIS